MLNLNYRISNGNGQVVGWPKGTLYARVALEAKTYADAGFTAVLFPPSTLGAAGEYSDGYDKKEDFILDGTAFGSQSELVAAVKALHAVGIQAGADLVLRQYDGYPKQEYRSAKFPKNPTCFAIMPGSPTYPGNVQPDSVPNSADGANYGDVVAYDQPNRYMWNGAIASATWLKETIGFDFFRIDEAKGIHAPFVYALLTSAGLKGCFAFGEYYDGSISALSYWVNTWMKRRAAVLDFNFKFNVQNIANNNSRVWMGQLASTGYCLADSAMAVTWCESADTDNTPGEQIVWNKLLAYALMLTYPGYPAVYYRDWSTDANCYGLTERINNLIWIHEYLAQGEFVVRLDTDFQVFVFERMGYGATPGCVVAVNNDRYNEYTRTIKTRYAAGIRLHEYTGNGGYANDRWVDSNGCITITLPKNNNGLSYLVYGEYL